MTWAGTSDAAIAKIEAGAAVPASNDSVTSAEMLGFLDEEHLQHIVPWLRKWRGENHGVRRVDVALVADQAEYRIPARAVGASVRMVTWINADGRESEPLTELTPEERPEYIEGRGYFWPTRYAYSVEGTQLMLCPTPAAADGSLRIRYVARPSSHVLVANAMLITSVAGGTSMNGTPPGTWTSTDLFDVIEGSGNFDLLALDRAGTIAPTKVELAVSLTEAAKGDYVALAGQTPVIQLPTELHPILIALGTARVLEAIGDPRWERKHDRALETLERARYAIQPRNESRSRKTINSGSSLRSGIQRPWRRS